MREIPQGTVHYAFLWFMGGDTALSSYARQLIEDRANERLHLALR